MDISPDINYDWYLSEAKYPQASTNLPSGFLSFFLFLFLFLFLFYFLFWAVEGGRGGGAQKRTPDPRLEFHQILLSLL